MKRYAFPLTIILLLFAVIALAAPGDKRPAVTSAAIGLGSSSSPTLASVTATTSVTAPAFTSSAADGYHYIMPYNSIAFAGTPLVGMIQTTPTGPQWYTGSAWEAIGSGGDSLPTQTGNSGKYLTTNGTTASWGAVVTSVTGSSPIVSSGGTSPAISISAATTSAAGSMSSADKTKLDGIQNTEYDNGTCTTSATISAANGERQKIMLTDAQTCALTFVQPSGGTKIIGLKIIQASSGSYNGAISGGLWPGATVPTITATSGAVDFVSCYLDGTAAYCAAAQDFR